MVMYHSSAAGAAVRAREARRRREEAEIADRMRAVALAKRQESVKYFGPSDSMRKKMINSAHNRMLEKRGQVDPRAAFRASGGVGAARWTVTPEGDYKRTGASAIRQR